MATETLQVRLLMQSGQYKREARQAASATGQIGHQARATGTATGNLRGQMGALATTAKVAVGGIAAGAVAKFGKDSVQAFLGFDDAMNQSLAIMGNVSDAMRQDMSDAAREVGKTTRLSAEEAAEAYFFLASAGLDAAQSISAMPQVAAFAQAGMFDMATATDLATDAQSALGLTVDDAQKNLENLTRVTDVFVRANTLANTSVEQVAAAMTNRAGAAMRALGIDIEEGTAVLAAFADQGVKGEKAGQQLGIVLRDLQTRAIENKEAFEEAGIAVFDSNGEFRNFGEVIADLEDNFSGLSDEQKRAELSTLGFSDRSIAALTTLLGTSDAIREYEKELRKAGGTTEEVADNQLDSMRGQLELAKGNIEDLQIALGEGLAPVLLATTELAGEVGGAVTTMIGPIADLIGWLDRWEVGTDDAGEATSVLDGIVEGAGNAFEQVAFFGIPSLIEALSGEKEAADDAGDSTDDLEEGVKDVGSASGSSAGEVDVLAGSIRGVGSASGSSAGEVEIFTDRASSLHGAWDDVVTSMEDYETMLRRLTDPVFAAVNDQKALEEATRNYQDVIKDPESTVGDQEQAMWDLVEAQRNAEESAANLPDDLQTAADHITILGDRAGITDEHLRILKDRIMEFDGLTAQSTISINVVGGERVPGDMNRDVVLRQHGGSVRANQPAIVGEAGPELWIPDHSGTVVPQSHTVTTGAVSMGQSGQTFVFYGDVYGDEGFRQRVREANVQNGRLGLN